MIKLSKEQIEEILELRDGFESQLQELNEMITQTTDRRLLKKIEDCKAGTIKNINKYNQDIVNGLKKYDYEVPEYLYIKL